MKEYIIETVFSKMEREYDLARSIFSAEAENRGMKVVTYEIKSRNMCVHYVEGTEKNLESLFFALGVRNVARLCVGDNDDYIVLSSEDLIKNPESEKMNTHEQSKKKAPTRNLHGDGNATHCLQGA